MQNIETDDRQTERNVSRAGDRADKADSEKNLCQKSCVSDGSQEILMLSFLSWGGGTRTNFIAQF